MTSAGALTDFQVEVARLFFSLPESRDFVLAGGAALNAQRLITRPTQDLDFFVPPGGVSVPDASMAFEQAAVQRGWSVHRDRVEDTFCRLVVHGTEPLLVDLAVDSPPLGPPTMTMVGPTYEPLELAGRKLVALFDRAEARDFADVYEFRQRFGTAALLESARSLDPGFQAPILAEMLGSLDRFTDREIPIAIDEVAQLRRFYAQWARELGSRSIEPGSPEL